MYVKQEAIEKTDRNQIEESRQKIETKPCNAPSNSQITFFPLMLMERSMIGVFLNLLVDCTVGFHCLDFRSTTPAKVTDSSIEL
jgi:hypothetical protein